MKNDELKYQRKIKKTLSENKRTFRKFKREKSQTIEERVKNFILRNSKNGFYTKISTLSYKFEIPQDQAWSVAGDLLADGILESIHDDRTGEMKLCEAGKIYEILDQEQKRKRQKSREFKKTRKNNA
jgi:hypothetical protein